MSVRSFRNSVTIIAKRVISPPFSAIKNHAVAKKMMDPPNVSGSSCNQYNSPFRNNDTVRKKAAAAVVRMSEAARISRRTRPNVNNANNGLGAPGRTKCLPKHCNAIKHLSS